MPVDGYPQLGIQPEPAASAVKKERPAYPGIKETLLKGVVSPSEQSGAYPAHHIKRACCARGSSSRQPVKKFQPRGVQLAGQILAQAHLEYLTVPCFQEYSVKKHRAGADFKPALC